MVIPAPTDPRAIRVGGVLMAIAVTGLLSVLVRRTLDRYLGPDDPRRFYIGELILYGGARS